MEAQLEEQSPAGPAEELPDELVAAEELRSEETAAAPDELAAEELRSEELAAEELAAGEPHAGEPHAGELAAEVALRRSEPERDASAVTPHHEPPMAAAEPALDAELQTAAPTPPMAPEPALGHGELTSDTARTPPPLPAPRTRTLRRGVVASPTSRGRSRSPLARLLAVLALALVVVAVVLLLRSLRTSHAKAPAPPAVVKVVIPEGKTRAQIAQITAKAHLSGSYRTASRRSPLLDPSHYGAPHGTASLEGFLFPATYDMNIGEPVSRLVEEQLLAFRENFGLSAIDRAHALHVTPYQLLTVASMVEREAQLPRDRAKIAAVIYNRLARGIPLGIDATIYYAVEQRTGVATYTHELTDAQLRIDSPYNTRTHPGLPPTPISNPGLASIQAAADPAHVPYLYYVAGADGCGEQVFSTTLAEFEANAAAYRAAVQKNGGHPPACKKK